MTETEAVAKPSRLRQIPGGIWALGFVSLLMDVSSEMIHALLPVYLVSVLGASMTSVGAIEGIAESTASIVKIFSGALSDWLGRRKFLATLGYGLAALTKPAFPLAQGIDVLIAARFVDRVGKGIRGAPRDALVADIAPPALRGASFGLRQSLDTIGAFLGPALAIGLMWLSADNFKLVFWAAVPPALLAVALLLVAVKEPERHGGAAQLRFPLRFSELARLGGAFWLITLIGTVFALAHFSEAFLILRARDAGLPLALSPLVLVAMNVVYAIIGLSRWGAFGRLRPADRPGVGPRAADRRRSRARGLQRAYRSVHRRLALGLAHGTDARPVGDAGRGCGRGGAARHGLRHVQPIERPRDARGQPDRRRPMGPPRRPGDVLRRSGFRGGGARRAGSREMARAGAWSGA